MKQCGKDSPDTFAGLAIGSGVLQDENGKERPGVIIAELHASSVNDSTTVGYTRNYAANYDRIFQDKDSSVQN